MAWLLVIVGVCCMTISCTAIYKTLGMTPEQTSEQLIKDSAAVAAAVDAGRVLFWQIVSSVLGGGGTILCGLLAKWLGMSNKMLAAVITGVEAAGQAETKAAIMQVALATGIEPKLDARVQALTA